MKKFSQSSDCQEFQQNSKSAADINHSENCDAMAGLSDDDLDLVAAAGDVCVPTMNPEVVLGRHDIPADEERRRP